MSKESTVCFVTGGSGFIGRNLIALLIEQGYSVIALARSHASANTVSALGAQPLMGDIADARALSEGMAQADYLFHLAADTNHGFVTAEQEESSRVAVNTVYNAARNSGIKRAVHVSTEAVLLDGRPLVKADETRPIPQQFPGSYSKLKAFAEQTALTCGSEAFEVVVVRPRLVWGRDDSTALPQLIDAARSGKLAWIDGGHYQTSTTHIANLCHALILALKRGQSGEVYFVTDDNDQVFRPFIERLLATQKVEAPNKSVPRWLVKGAVELGDLLAKISNGRVSGPMSRQEYATLGNTVTLDISKAKTQLGYRPVISVEQGLQELATQTSNSRD